MATSDLYLNPSAGSPTVISIGSQCYRLVGPSPTAPNTSSFDTSYADCDTCVVPCTDNCIQLGSSVSFVATCNGKLYLYYNDQIAAWGDNGGSYTVVINGSSYTVHGINTGDVADGGLGGIAGPNLVLGNTYSVSASGYCWWAGNPSPVPAYKTDPDGVDGNGNPPGIAGSDFCCPGMKSFSLVGKMKAN